MGNITDDLTYTEENRNAWFANLRHSLRTPLNTIIGFSEILLEDVEGQDEQGIIADLQKINVAGRQMLGIVNKILDPIKLDQAELDLNTIGANLHYELRIPLNAALGYSEILLEDAEAEQKEQLIPDLEKIHISVNRLLAMLNALKIPRFQTNKRLDKEIASDSVLIDNVRTTTSAFEEEVANQLFQASLLVVDDNDLNRNLLSRRLEKQGCQIFLAENGRQALEMVKERRFDLILLDTVMPEMNGLQVLETLKSDPKFKNIPVIMISAFDEIDSVVACIELGAEDYLMKPFNPLILKARIGTCLEKKRLRDKEVEYLRNVKQLTVAANSVESGTFDLSSLIEVAQRKDELGSLARVFQNMAKEVHNREIVLETKIKERTIKLDETIEELNRTIGQLKISEKTALEAEKKAIEASQAKTIFLASMSHELRTPLTAILGFAQLMERSKERDTEDKEQLEIILRSGEHLLGLINDVLSISKIEAGKISLQEQILDLPKLLKTLEEMMAIRAKNKSIKLNFNYQNELPQYVFGDEGKLRQVLINLLSNAIKFTEQGEVNLSISWQNDRCYFEVKDTGYGISKEDMEKLFNPFVQTQSGQKAGEGTGLGLAISKQFVELMGGTINVYSQLAIGTSFSFDIKLPLSKEIDIKQTNLKVKSLAPEQPAFRILVAEDKWEERMLLTKLLTSIGFNVRFATNGKETLEIWKDWQPHLIWLDLNMPIINGYLAAKIIRDLEMGKIVEDNIVEIDFSNLKIKNPHTVIIALTASVLEHERNVILANGCDSFVGKPYQENTIFDKLVEYLGVKYLYQEIKAVEIKKKQDSNDIIGKIALLPTELVNQLREFVTLGDIDKAYQLVEKISSHDEILFNYLKSLLKTYRLDELLSILN